MAPVTMSDEELRRVVDGEDGPTVSPEDALRYGGGTINVEDVDEHGQVRVSTEAIEQVAAAARGLDVEQLPLFENYRVPAASITFGGSLDFDISKPSDLALIQALKWGKRVIVRLYVDEDGDAPQRVALDAEVTARSFAFKGKDGIPTTTAKVTVDYRRAEEE